MLWGEENSSRHSKSSERTGKEGRKEKRQKIDTSDWGKQYITVIFKMHWQDRIFTWICPQRISELTGYFPNCNKEKRFWARQNTIIMKITLHVSHTTPTAFISPRLMNHLLNVLQMNWGHLFQGGKGLHQGKNTIQGYMILIQSTSRKKEAKSSFQEIRCITA